MKINEVEQKVGITKKNIRFYEQEGLLKPDRNAQNGYREYSEEDLLLLQKIKLLRKLSIPRNSKNRNRSSDDGRCPSQTSYLPGKGAEKYRRDAAFLSDAHGTKGTFFVNECFGISGENGAYRKGGDPFYECTDERP